MNSLFTDEERKAAELAVETNAGHPFWKAVIEGDNIEGLYLGSRSWKTDYGNQVVATIDAHLGQSAGNRIVDVVPMGGQSNLERPLPGRA